MKQLHFHNMNTGPRFAGLQSIRKLLLGAALGVLLLSLGTSAAPQPQTTPCQQLNSTLATVLSYGKLAGAIELREVMIVTGLASRLRAWATYRAYEIPIQAALERKYADPEYDREWKKWRATEATALKAFGCHYNPFNLLIQKQNTQ